ncbi:hypothetical protein FB45DRAFT_1004296 [Roridomyces roridus]|uniref:Uncharacterized protein n=1 Tax=Roridomyces roridus TaxID=1738132 RepID=A0AAD7BRN7_9AGAR|nr:hypothetical protein FB45DRAFT_1004296 [Roridomyces roridus]
MLVATPAAQRVDGKGSFGIVHAPADGYPHFISNDPESSTLGYPTAFHPYPSLAIDRTFHWVSARVSWVRANVRRIKMEVESRVSEYQCTSQRAQAKLKLRFSIDKRAKNSDELDQLPRTALLHVAEYLRIRTRGAVHAPCTASFLQQNFSSRCWGFRAFGGYPAMHSFDLSELIDIEISQPVIEYLVSRVFPTVSYSLERSGVPPSFIPPTPKRSPPSWRPSSSRSSTSPPRAPTSPSLWKNGPWNVSSLAR